MFRRLVTGSALQIISLFANIAVAMAMMPFIIHNLGDVDYGLWVLVASFIGYYGLLDFGMSTATTRFISRADGQGDVEEMNIILNTAGAFFAALGVFVFLACAVTAMVVDSSKAALLWLTVGITCIFQFGLRGFYGLYFARIRQDILGYTTLAKLTFRTIATVYYLNLGYGVVAVAIITMLSEIIFYGVDMIILRKIVPEMKISRALVQPSRIKELINYGKFSMVIQISDLLKLRALPVIVTYTVGLPFVVFFAIAIRLMEMFHQVLEKVIHMLTPVFSQYEGRGETHHIVKVFWMSYRINLIMSILIGGGIMVFSGNFIAWWIGAEYDLAHTLTLWLSVAFIMFTINETGKTALFGTSKHQKFAWVSLIESVSAALFGVVGGFLEGPVGIVVGMGSVIVAFEMTSKPYIICQELGISLFEYAIVAVEAGYKLVVPIAIWAYFLNSWTATSIYEILSMAALFVASLSPFAWSMLGAETQGTLTRKVLSRIPYIGIKC